MSGSEFDVEEATTRVRGPVVTQVPVHVSWTDANGPQAQKVDDDANIGSAPDLTLCVADRTVSRLHARFELRSDGPWIVDLSSTNGTHVDGVKLSAGKLRDGSVVRVGDTSLTVRFGTPKDLGVWPEGTYGPLVGESGAMRRLFAILDDYAATSDTVLITGETGTGKDVVAQAIHESSPRRDKKFIVVDCGAIPESLVESELFGHAQGAFSGAERRHDGSFGDADGGTLFLDEIGELPMSVQPKLLRALESGMIRRVGESTHRPIDVRILAATHRDLGQMVSVGAFREDLYFRLAVLPVSIPPLRERKDDILPLARHFGLRELAPALEPLVVQRPWLGNSRELRNFVTRARTLGAERALESMPQPLRAPRLPPVDLDEEFRDVRDRYVNHLERMYLQGWLERTKWNVSATATALGIDRSYAHRLMKKHGLSRND